MSVGRIPFWSKEDVSLSGGPCDPCQNRFGRGGSSFLFGSLVALFSAQVCAAGTPNAPTLPDSAVPAARAASPEVEETTFVDTRKWGFGATAVMIPAVIPSAGGFVDVRYWFPNGFGIDDGAGFALPSVSPNVSYAALANVEGMWAFVERANLLIFLDLDALPLFFPLQNYTSSVMAFSLPVRSSATSLMNPRVSKFARALGTA